MLIVYTFFVLQAPYVIYSTVLSLAECYCKNIIKENVMANNQVDDKKEDVRNYANRHPRRMNGGAMLIGTILGASLATVKVKRNKSSVQKFMDHLNKQMK
jgi:hypothetical protein